MTAETDLLPLPKYPVDGAGDEDSYNTGWNDCLAECRANVAHATAAKDAEIARWREAAEWQGAMTEALLPYQDEAVAGRAEIEALRAEVEEVRNAYQNRTRDYYVCSAACEQQHARAERLAEALRYAEAFISVAVPQLARDRDEAVNEVLPAIRAALNPTAAQGDEAVSG